MTIAQIILAVLCIACIWLAETHVADSGLKRFMVIVFSVLLAVIILSWLGVFAALAVPPAGLQ
jgi:hypothetical protein